MTTINLDNGCGMYYDADDTAHDLTKNTLVPLLEKVGL